MSSYGHSLVPKHKNVVLLWSQTIPKNVHCGQIFRSNDCWVEKIQGEKWVESWRCGAAMVTKIVKTKHLKIYEAYKKPCS